MRLYIVFVLVLCKVVRKATRIRGHGGSALPGLLAEYLLPSFNTRMLGQLPEGVTVVSGTNGKTSTTKMIVEVLEASGKRVLTNGTGSNFTRGIASAIVTTAHLQGRLPYDIAVFELDEAYAVQFAAQCKPAYAVALNVMRDQLDRFTEVDHTARLLRTLLQSATKGCVINGDDPSLTVSAADLSVPISYFGVAPGLRSHFPTDEDMFRVQEAKRIRPTLSVELTGFRGQKVSYRLGSHLYSRTMSLRGQYNFQNAAACIALVRMVVPQISSDDLLNSLARVGVAFGRGEVLHVAGRPLEIILVKNPSGFRQALLSFNTPAQCMIAINNYHADGRDVSWLWDVDFSSLRTEAVYAVTGTRAQDMARRLRYDDVPVQIIEPDIHKSLNQFIHSEGAALRRIFCTYTAMLAIRKQIAAYTEVSEVL